MLTRPLIAALLAGFLSATGFAPLDWWPVTLACLAVLLHLTWHAPSLKSALLRGWVFGVGHFTLGNNWIQHAFDYQDKMPPVLGYFAVLLLALYLAVYPAIAMGLAWRFARSVKARWNEPDIAFVLAAAAAWILGEYLRGTLFTGYPWNPMGVIWVATPIAQLAAWIGTYALSGLTLLVAGALYLATQRQYRVPVVIAAALIAFGFALHPGQPVEDMTRPHVRIVQPNIGQDGVDAPDYAPRVLNKLAEWSGQPHGVPRLVVWPEGMVNYLIEDGYPREYYRQADPRWVRGRIGGLLGPQDRAMVGGNALFFAGNEVSGVGNSVWVVDPAGMLGARYDKAHLVPYGEYLPMRTLLAPLGLARLVMGDFDFLPGPGPKTLDVPGFGKSGVAICYEIIFSGQIVDRRNRPDFLFNPSNDAWFGSWGPVQHLAQARLRAIEEGLPILRATPTGISAVIDARGRLIGTVPAGQEGAIEAPLPAPLPATLFARLGNWLALIAGLASVVLAIAFRRLAR
ncbi:apolipoprotein N-acyltransferase [Sphingomonas sp. HITSZ_GF]|uniref:apolipoprotein N-acyltransferase n=1 Tax=Sphingomonas sp. HITSZ_GF TaxID=3037247 RepID=UPI00240E2B1E|nr:apolipoprotein N-acyltransferase [Sphingomonas sp. HITSZ_GF]MDG2535698.1 apolipoprotein N-acyltransferase [Sphingomonas sp. HITSZ_GF]